MANKEQENIMERPLTLNQQLLEDNPHIQILLADGFEEAFIGVGYQFNKTIAVYDKAKCHTILMQRDGMTLDEAAEFLEFNCIGAYVGPQTPVFMDYSVFNSKP